MENYITQHPAYVRIKHYFRLIEKFLLLLRRHRKLKISSDQPCQTPVYGWSFWFWLSAVFLVVLLASVLFIASAVRHISEDGTRFSVTQSRVIMSIAEFPFLVKTALIELKSYFTNEPLPLLLSREVVEQPYWVRKFPSTTDTGYLLFSGVDASSKRAVVELIRISDGVVLAKWVPDWPAIFKKTSAKKYAPLGSQYAAKPVHPLLLADGDIVFGHNGGSLVRMSPCSSEPVWVLDEVIHHSIELDLNGAGIWAPSVSLDGFSDNPWLQGRVRDDAIAHVSLDGRLLERFSFARILRQNGLQALLLGMSGERLSRDPIHLNEIKVARSDSRYWQRGDLLISSRHLSTLFLYRPSTNKILWYKTGPWMSQHSADFVDEHRISVFDNHVTGGGFMDKSQVLMNPHDINRVYVYDFDDGKLTQPFEALLADARPLTITAGRARILPDGGLFLEDTNNGRDMRFSKESLLWSRINDFDEKRIGVVSWGRYLTAEEAAVPLRAITARHCQWIK
ncbi:MAG: arylsulfotransferase family protein [Gallionella sp.]|nr:arylsulfotransferase family protein [Gallionella sp.]MDD4946168.1 arylsulfotransferase family protein [Gallionella sp.]